MPKLLKAKMLGMIEYLTDQFLINSRWRHLVINFETSQNKPSRNVV